MKEDNYYIELIRKYEPVFLKAGELSVKLQSGVIAKKKLTTSTYEIDVVTDADIQIQETILSALSKTELSECRVVAEEKTESVDKFNQDGELLLAIDPIDGTYRYAAGAPIYSMIISIQKFGLPLYTFAHYPAIGWTHRFINKAHYENGQKPTLSIKNTEKVITYSYGNPKEKVPETVKQKMETRGYTFLDKKVLTSDCGATTILLAEAVDGYYCEDPLVVDGLVGMHYALAYNLEIQSDIAKEPKPGLGGIRYSGYYFVIRK
jgi:fructose-1,6-bisphosphatase/inositol monophosphatase family enzyme